MPLFENIFQPKTKRLLDLKKAGESSAVNQEWQDRAIRTMIKHLTKHSAIDELERAIVEENPNSKCVTIPTLLAQDHSLLDVNGNPTPPQLISCQFWRWPGLQTIHELRSTQTCETGVGNNTPSLDSNQSAGPPLICINPFHYDKVMSPRLPPVLVPKSLNLTNLEMLGMSRTTDRSTNSLSNLMPSIQPDVLMLGDHGNIDFSLESNRDMMFFEDMTTMQPQTNGNNTDSANIQSNRMETSAGGNEASQPSTCNGATVTTVTASGSFVEMEPIMFIEPTYWCQVIYYELGKQVGTFNGRPRAITIDGYVDPCSSDRLCLGHFSNPERNAKVDDTRRHIGKGVRLWYIGGEVHVECLSQCAIWVQSLNCNQRFGWHPLTVVKIPPGNHLNIFSNSEFAKTLNQAVASGYHSVYSMVDSACSIRISFAKGWGAEYRRQRITDCHCWVEIHLNGPLQWLDRVLSTMPSTEQTGSGT